MRHKTPIMFAAEIALIAILLSLSSPSSTVSYAAAALTYTVNSTADTDDGTCNATHCTLREAINAANANPGQDMIAFNIPGAGPHTISPLTPLPAITDPVIIDGTTQPGANCTSWPPTLRIELAGPGTGKDNGLTLSTDNSLIRGLVINRFDTSELNGGRGIFIMGRYNQIQCNFIGTDITGTLPVGNRYGVTIYSYNTSHNLIGTNGDGLADETERNLISGNTYAGISDSASHTVVAGNYIGTDINGTVTLGNGRFGISPGYYSRIGTDANGIADDMERNIISGNGYAGSWTAGGILFYDERNVTIAGNYIGTDVTGLEPLGNDSAGIVFYANATNNLIGGTSPAASNLIAFNQRAGIYIAWHCVDDSCLFDPNPIPAPITHNTIRGNSIHSNEGLGINIDLVEHPQTPDGPLPNDPGDVDTGLNDNQNYPVLTTVTSHTVTGTLDSQPNSTYMIEFFSQAECDPSGYGEGEVFRGATNVSTDASGYAAFTHTFAEPLPVGHILTSTATNATGSTSEFSLCATITEQNSYTVTNTNDSGAGSLRQTILDANMHPGFDVIAFNIPGTGPHTIAPLTALPDITDPVQIDGCSQPGADCSQWPPTLKIELDGMNATIEAGLTVTSGNSIIRGLTINRFQRGLWLKTGSWNHLYGNFIGTDITGTLAARNYVAGVVCESDHNIIGTNGDGVSDVVERNLLSGNVSTGIGFGLSLLGDSNVVAGNFIGSDVTGTQPLGNHTGIYIEGSGNRIGTNTDGISDELERNIISANIQMGIGFYGEKFNNIYPAIVDTVIKGNYIGTSITGTQPLGNSGLAGIGFYGSIDRTIVGGPSPVEQNIIAFNTGLGGIILTENGPAPLSIQNTLRGNRIHSNTGLGIELNIGNSWILDGPTPNDPGDTDTGSNNQQNFPVLTTVTPTLVAGMLNSTPNTTFTLDFYSNTACDPSGYGEGESFQRMTEPATVTTDANGDVAFSFTFVNSIPADQVVTATATDPQGNTSEFSLCRALSPSLSINDVTVLEGNSNMVNAVFTVSLSKASSDVVTVNYATANRTARAGSDYTATSGSLTFQPGVTSQTITVPVLGDTAAEGSETFVINLSNPQNALLGDAQGTGIITDQTPWLYSPANGTLTRDATPRFIWRAADGATAYRLQVDNNADFSSPVLSPIATTISYTPAAALSNGQYYWRVRAKDASGQWGPWSERWSLRVDSHPPAVPVLLSPANKATLRDSTPTFRWEASTGADLYRLQLDNNADFSSPVINILTPTTSYTRPASLGDRVYYWRVLARDAAGNISRWSVVRSFTLDAVQPMPEPTATLPATLMPAPSDTPSLTPTEVIASSTPTPAEGIIEPLRRVESDHPAVQQTGGWTSHTTDAASGGSYLYSSGSFDDVLGLTFTGTQVEVIYVKHPALGTFAVEIDGTFMQLVDSVAAESEFGAVVLVNGLADGQHTLRIYPVAGVVALDAFGVAALPEVSVTLTPTSIPSEQPTVVVTPTDVPPGEPTLTPSATATPLPLTLPLIETFDSGLNWQPVGAWVLDTQNAHQGAVWFADSTTRDQNSTLTFGAQLDLGTAQHPELTFWQKMALASEDVFSIEATLDSGLTWQAVDLQSGSTLDWTQRVVDLTAYRGQAISLRFRLDTLNVLSEGAVTIGVWVDDLVIQETIPTPTPTLVPTNETTVQPSSTPVPPTATDLPTSTSIPTETPTETPTATPTQTLSPSATPTETPEPTATPTGVITEILPETPEPVATEEPAS